MGKFLNPEPFSYPETRHVRRHGPHGWTNYQRYRPWLRDEFTFRCVYCLEREKWRDMRTSMQIDHFQPHVLRPDLAADYDNLLYLCPNCNLLKGSKILPDPCRQALGKCLKVHSDGTIEAVNGSTVGRVIIDVLRLDDPLACERRKLLMDILKTLSELQPALYARLMSFPSDLPDLSDPSVTPPGNSRPEGVDQSYSEQRKRGILPDVY